MNIHYWFPLGWTGWISLIHRLRSLLQQHSPKASILWCLAFFITQFSHSYMTTGKTIALTRWTRWTFVGKVMSLFFNMLYMLVIAFLPRSKCLLISWLQSPSTVIFSQSASSVTQSCPTLCNPMNRSTPGFPVHHQLPEFTQTHIHRVSDAIQPSHPLSSPYPTASNPSQHQSVFQWVNSPTGRSTSWNQDCREKYQ